MSVIERALRSPFQIRASIRGWRARLSGITQHHVIAEVVVPRFRELLIDADNARVFAGIVNSGQSPAIAFGDRRQDRASRIGRRRRWNRAPYQTLRVVDEDS